MWFMPMAKELIERDSMSQSALDRLVKMVNQIALNMRANGSDAMVADQVAQHVQRFWSPAMKNVLIQESEETDIGLSPVALLAVQALMKLQQANHAD
jgi:formate dehydrogenase subunit delta